MIIVVAFHCSIKRYFCAQHTIFAVFYFSVNNSKFARLCYIDYMNIFIFCLLTVYSGRNFDCQLFASKCEDQAKIDRFYLSVERVESDASCLD